MPDTPIHPRETDLRDLAKLDDPIALWAGAEIARLRAALDNAERRAGHTNGRPLDPPCGFCHLARQCERCAEIVRSSRAERDRDTALARVAELEARVRDLTADLAAASDTPFRP